MEILRIAIKTPNCPNLILYGNRYSQTYECLHTLLYDEYHLKDMKIAEGGFGYRHSRYYHELDVSTIKHKNYALFKKTLYDIVKRSNPFSNYQKNLVVFRRYDRVKDTIQGFLRVVLERYRKTTLFVLITESYPSVHEAIRSRASGIRFSRDITPLRYDIYRTICEPLLKIYRSHDTTLSLATIRILKEISYQILKYPLDISEVCQSLCKMIGETPEWTNNHKHYMISYIAKFQRGLKLSYRKIIHMEGFLITLWDLSHRAYYDLLTADDKVYRDDEKQVHVSADATRVHEHHKHEKAHVDVGHDIANRVQDRLED
jgi:hypothetical protein